MLLSKYDSRDVDEEVLLNEQNITPKLRSINEEPNKSNLWYLDNGASNHMTGGKEKFRELDNTIRGYVKFGDGSRVRIEGKGSIIFQCKNGEKRLLQEVYFIPSLCNNIISLGQLVEDGDRIRMHGSFLWIRDKNGKLLMKVKRSPNRLYKIILNEVEQKCLLGSIHEPSWLWHARLGHVNFHALKHMSTSNIVSGLPKIECLTQVCEGCLVGKQTRQSYPSQATFKAGKRLALVHGDLCGPISPTTCSGEKVKAFRTDRGWEFCSKQFTAYYEETGLKHYFTAPYSPQQNGVVERRNRTVIEMARSMLNSMHVPDMLWGEAVRHAVYILNRVSTKALKESTPYETWAGRKPNIEHMRVFGCVAHMKIVGGHLRKLEIRSRKMVYLGTEMGSKAYRLLDPDTGKIHVSRDVSFEEDRSWSWGQTTKFKTTVGATFTLEGYHENNNHEENEMQMQTP